MLEPDGFSSVVFQALEVRLADLANGFEEATIDKNNQEDKTIKMDKALENTARLRKVYFNEHFNALILFYLVQSNNDSFQVIY